MKFLDHTSIICLEYREFVPVIVPENTYNSLRRRGNIAVHGRGKGDDILIEFETLPERYKRIVISQYGDVYKFAATAPLLRLLKTDIKAREFYATKLLPDGRNIPLEHQGKYTRQAEWLNLVILALSDKRTIKETLRISIEEFWNTVIALYTIDKIKNDLPRSKRRLLEKYYAYQRGGYAGLVEVGRFTQQNARKVDATIERLLLSLYCRPHKPYISEVCNDYQAFMGGALQVVDLETGEVFSPATYQVSGKNFVVNYRTVKYYINKPLNRAIVDKYRLSNLEYNNTHRPHMLREAPFYALSKITMDDTSSPFKQHNGVRPATYKVFDVASGALIAVVLHRKARPDVKLIRRLLAEMMALIVTNEWAMPYEVEVERALMTGLKGGEDENGNFVNDVLTAGAVFPFIRFCAPRNPQEKRAEGFINQLKHQFHKHREGFQARPFARLEANRRNEDKKEVTFSFEDICSFELEDAAAWNSCLHPDQDKYPGLTRWQVLSQVQNPNLMLPNVAQVIPYLGNKTNTSVKRAFIEVQSNVYRLPNMANLEELQEQKVTAYWLPNKNKEIPSVYIYQGDTFICEAPQADRFQEAKAEQTEEDRKIMGKQKAYINAFDQIVRDRVEKLNKLGVTLEIPAQNQLPALPAIIQNSMSNPGGGMLNQDSTNPGEKMQNSDAEAGGYVQNFDAWDAPPLDVEAIKRRAIAGL